MNRLPLSIHRNVVKRYPLAALLYCFGKPDQLHRTMILTGARFLLDERFDASLWQSSLREVECNELIPMNRYNSSIQLVGNVPQTTLGKLLYAVIRTQRPEIVVETGVAHGTSSWIILNALHKNRFGRLYSIDLPNNDTNEAYNFRNSRTPFTGWVVPDGLRKRWTLILGPSQAELPKLIEKLPTVDVFFHDSDHSYGNMEFEFTLAWTHLSPGGLMLSDDVHKNDAFTNFVRRRNIKSVLFRKGGAAVKNA